MKYKINLKNRKHAIQVGVNMCTADPTDYGYIIKPTISWGAAFLLHFNMEPISSYVGGTLAIHDVDRGWTNEVNVGIGQYADLVWEDGTSVFYAITDTIRPNTTQIKLDKIRLNGNEIGVFDDVYANKIEFSGEWMGASKVTTTIESPDKIDFSIGDSIEYRGQLYYLRNIPSVKKTGVNRYKYENIVFEGVEGELANMEMLDTVLNGDATTQHTLLPNWSVFCPDVIEFAERVKANTDRMQNPWEVSVVLKDGTMYDVGVNIPKPSKDSIDGTKDVVVSINGESIWDSLKNLHDKFKLNFYTVGRKLIIGNNNIVLPNRFAYGKGNGLYQIERNADPSQKIITRLYPRGNSRNMPLRFYQNVNIKMYAEFVDGDFFDGSRPYGTIHQGQLGMLLGDDVAKKVWSEVPSNCNYYAFFKDIKRSAIRCLDTEKWITTCKVHTSVGEEEVTCYMSNDPVGLVMFFTPAQTEFSSSVFEERVYFDAGANRNYWNVAHLEADGQAKVPNNVSIQNLMLPWFGIDKTLDSLLDDIYVSNKYPTAKAKLVELGLETKQHFMARVDVSADDSGMCLVSAKAADAGYVEGSVTFDGSTDGYEDIYPSLQYCGDNNVIVSADVIEDNGIFDKETEIANFHVVVNLDFDPRQYISYGSNSFTMHMQTGYCGGRDFNVVGVRDLGENNYRLTVQRSQDSLLNLYFPYKAEGSTDAYQIKAGDKFVFTDIDMPDEYVFGSAVNALFPAAVKYLISNDTPAYKYALKLDRIQVQRWCDSQEEGNTFHDIVNAGVALAFGERAFSKEYFSVTIDKLTIKEGEDILPTYEVTLSNDKTIGTIQRIQNQIDRVTANVSAIDLSKVGKGEKGDKGADGSSGIQGCVIRPCGKYDPTVAYYNDSELDEPRAGEAYRVIDIVSVELVDGSIMSFKRTPYKNGEAGVEPADNEYWDVATQEKFVATDVLMSNEAWIETLTGKSIYVTDEDNNIKAGMQSVNDNTTPQIFAGAEKSNANNANYRVYGDGRVVMNLAEINSEDKDHNKVRINDGSVQIISPSGDVKTTISQLSPDTIQDALPSTSSADYAYTDSIAVVKRENATRAKTVNARVISNMVVDKELASLRATSKDGMLVIPRMEFVITLTSSEYSGGNFISYISNMVSYLDLYVNNILVQSVTATSVSLSDRSSVSEVKTVATSLYSTIADEGATFNVEVKLRVVHTIGVAVPDGTEVSVPTFSATLAPRSTYRLAVSYDSYMNKILGNGFVFASQSDSFFAYNNSVPTSGMCMELVQGDLRLSVKNQMNLISKNNNNKWFNVNPLVFAAKFITSAGYITLQQIFYNPYDLQVSTGNAKEDGKIVHQTIADGNYKFYHTLFGQSPYFANFIPQSSSHACACIDDLKPNEVSMKFFNGSSLTRPYAFIFMLYDGRQF